MATTTKQYDGDLAVATLVLAFLLTLTQIGFVADGLMAVSGQGWFLSLLFAIVIATGLLHSQFVLTRLMEIALPRRYAWCFCGLTASITGMMSIYGMTALSQPWTYKWFLGAFLGSLVPLQTTLLANMTTGMFSLAGKNWYRGSISESVFSVVLSKRGKSLVAAQAPKASPPATLAPSLALTLAVEEEEKVLEETPSSNAVEQSPPPVVPGPAAPLAAEPPVTAAKPVVPVVQSSVQTTTQTVIKPTPLTTSEPIFSSATRSATYSFNNEDRVTLRLHAGMTKRQWKDLHSELRRLGGILWDDVEVTKEPSQDGSRVRTLSGKITFPEHKGKKTKQKRENARIRHMETLLDQLKAVVERYNTKPN